MRLSRKHMEHVQGESAWVVHPVMLPLSLELDLGTFLWTCLVSSYWECLPRVFGPNVDLGLVIKFKIVHSEHKLNFYFIN